MKTFFFSWIAILFCSAVFAQSVMVTGTVYDDTGQPLPGVNVLVTAESIGTTTDFNGSYTLEVPSNSILEFSYLGFETQAFTITSARTLDVTLSESSESLNEVVIIGYGKKTKKEITGAVSVVDDEVIEALKPTRIEQALQGQVAGVNITSTSGAPGAASNIRIRGISTNGDNRPLILVDGNVIEDLSVISPGDIESLTVLKDATAGIYGVRAANGVILITTKSGRRNQDLDFMLETFGGVQNTTRRLPALNATEYALLKNEAFANGGLALPFPNVAALGEGTDYQDEVFENAAIYNTNFSVRGGTDKSAYGFWLSYLDQDGIVGGDKSNFKRYTVRANYDYDLLENLKLKSGILYAYTDRSTLAETGLGSVLFNALNVAPTISVFDANGDFSLADGVGQSSITTLGNEIINPLAQIDNTFNENFVSRISANLGLNYEIIEGLNVEARIQANYADARGNSFAPEAFYGSGKVFNIDRNVYNEYENYFRDYTFDAFAAYATTFADKHNLNATLGMSVFQTTGKFTGFTGFDIPNNSYDAASLANATDIVDNFINGGNTFDARLLSYFARAQYDYDKKYLLSAVIRRDGSSKFGPENKFGYFPSASAGWVVSEESFLNESSTIDFLKLRVSAGIIGNDRIPDFRFVSLLNGEGAYVFDNTLQFGTASGAISNPEIKWEEQETFNVGLDARFFQSKLDLTLDYYVRTTRDLLISPTVSGILGTAAPGSSAPVVNGGDVRNKGLEVSVGWRDDVGDDISYSIRANAATLDNEVLRVDNQLGFEQGGAFGVGQAFPSRFQEGEAIGYFFGYQTDGIFQSQAEVDAHPSQLALGAEAQPGDLRFVDINQDGVIDDEDRTNIGDPIPTLQLGLNLQFNYKNWDFQSYFFASIGNDIVRNYERSIPLANVTNRNLNRWTGPGSTNEFPRVTTDATSNNVFSDFFVEDGSYLRANNIQIGYTFSDSLLSNSALDSLRVYASVNNAFTLTDYSGYDPSASDGNPIGGGIDYGFYPVPRTMILGLNFNF